MPSDCSLWFKSPLDKTCSESDFMHCISVFSHGTGQFWAKPGNSSSSSKEGLLLLIELLIQNDRENNVIQLDLWFWWNIVISCELGTIGNHHNNYYKIKWSFFFSLQGLNEIDVKSFWFQNLQILTFSS